MGHVFVRLSGHRVRLVPHWPYRFARLADDLRAVEVTRWTADGPLVAIVGPDRNEPTVDVVDVVEGPDHNEWLIETSIFSICWPEGFTVESPQDPVDHTKFYLCDPDDAVIFPQGPVPTDRLVAPDALIGPGQTVDARRRVGDVQALELSYEHDGRAWWQGHWMIPFGERKVLVMTAQAPVSTSASTRTAAEAIVASLA